MLTISKYFDIALEILSILLCILNFMNIIVRFMQYASLFHFILNIVCFPEMQQLTV